MRTITTLCLALCCFPLHGQQSTARILGTITDPSGAAIPGATVTATTRLSLQVLARRAFVAEREATFRKEWERQKQIPGSPAGKN